MKALFSIVSLVVVLCIVTVTVQRQLHAARLAAGDGTSAAGASAPSRATTAQYERDVHRALDAGMAQRASQAETGEAGR
jgi:hypothetical protein